MTGHVIFTVYLLGILVWMIKLPSWITPEVVEASIQRFMQLGATRKGAINTTTGIMLLISFVWPAVVLWLIYSYVKEHLL